LVGRVRGLILRYYPGIRVEGLRKTTKNLNQDSRSPGSRFEAGTSQIRSRTINHSTTTFGGTSGERGGYFNMFDHGSRGHFCIILGVTFSMMPRELEEMWMDAVAAYLMMLPQH
jgi:hypothetical protein